MASLHHVNQAETVGKVTIQIRGKSSCHVSELNRLAFLLAEVMDELGLEGVYTLVPQRRALPGSTALKGLSIDGTNHNVVGIGFQPAGNATRARYDLQTADAQDLFRKLKDRIGTAYNGKVIAKAKPVEQKAEPVVQESDVAPQSLADATFEKPTQPPGVYYTKDPDWMLTFVLLLSDLADKHPQHQVKKEQVLNLIVERTHFPNRAGTAPIYLALINRGYIVQSDDTCQVFKVVENPLATFKASNPWSRKPKLAPKKKSKVVATKKVRSIPSERKQKYLSDEEWMRSFMDGLRELVDSASGLVSKTDLHRFIKERTNQKKVAGMVYKVLEGLEVRGLVILAGDKLYRVVYEPKPDTLNKAVEAMASARVEAAQMFEGFAQYKLPNFAEGMFTQPQLLNTFLELLAVGETSSAKLHEVIDNWFPGSYRSSRFQLLDYLVGRGYLLRPQKGYYTLGPKGRELLGLPPVVYTTVDKLSPPVPVQSEPVEVVPSPVEQPVETPAAQEESEPMLSQAPQAFMPVADNAVPPVSLEEIAATATAIGKAKRNKVAAEEAEARKSALQARKAELQARRDELCQRKEQGPSPEVVQAALMQKLIAMAHEL